MPRLTLVTAVLLSAFLVMRLPRSMDPLDSFAVAEQARVRAHFDSAEREVRGNPVSGLSTAQRAARARALDRLHTYAMRGVFPRNRDFPGALVPYFVDRVTGTRCAMAYLIEESGARAFVARVAATHNNARIPEIERDPQLIAWLEENGMTPEEAARIQPSYCGEPEYQRRPGFCGATTEYKIATGVSVAADMVTVALNVRHTRLSRSLTGSLGIASGVIGIALGVNDLAGPPPGTGAYGSRITLGFLNIGVGAATVGFGVYGAKRRPRTQSHLSFAPWLDSNGAPGFSGRVVF